MTAAAPPMLDAFLASLPLALGMAAATLPLVTVPLLLAAQGARGVQAAFLVGWFAAFLALGGAVIAASDLTAPRYGTPAPWTLWARALIGAALLGLAWAKWSRPKAGPPAWMARIQTLGARGAALLGAALLALNPKNAILAASGALEIARATPAPPAQAGALALFALAASAALVLPFALTLTLGEAARRPLAAARDLVARHDRALTSAVLAALGLLLLAGALAALT